MDGFSTASVTSSCEAISRRALSTVVEIEAVAKHVPAEDPRLRQLLFLSTKLRQFGQHTDQLQHCLSATPVISETLQGVIVCSLKECEVALAVVGKQVNRVGPLDVPRLDLGAIVKFQHLLISYSRLFIFVMQLLSLVDVASQDSKLNSAAGQQLVDDAKASSAATIMSGVDLLGTVGNSTAGEGSNSGFTEGTSPSVAVEASPPPSDEPPAAPERSRKSGFAKGLSSLTTTLKAMTSSMRPRPEPFVSPLCQAAARGNVPQVRGLLGQGANINGRNEDGNTALICAITSGQSETATLLVESGADATIRDWSRKRRPPLFHALEAGELRIAELLLRRGAKTDERNLVGQPFFVDLALTGPLDSVRLCLQHGADANARDLTGRTIICQAASRGNVPLARLLLDHGANPNDRDVVGNTLLLATMRNARLPEPDRAALIRLLLERGARADEPDTWGVTALAHAAAADNLDLLTLLLDGGADPDRAVHGDSLLVNAIDRRRWDQVWALVEHGRADPSRADARGRTPLAAAVQSQNPDVVQLLVQRGAAPGPAG